MIPLKSILTITTKEDYLTSLLIYEFNGIKVNRAYLEVSPKVFPLCFRVNKDNVLHIGVYSLESLIFLKKDNYTELTLKDIQTL